MCGRLMANYAVTLACFQHQRIKLEYIQDGIIQKEFLWFWMDSWGLTVPGNRSLGEAGASLYMPITDFAWKQIMI